MDPRACFDLLRFKKHFGAQRLYFFGCGSKRMEMPKSHACHFRWREKQTSPEPDISGPDPRFASSTYGLVNSAIALAKAHAFDRAIIISSSTDQLRVHDQLTDLGKEAVLAHWNAALGSIRAAADYEVNLDVFDALYLCAGRLRLDPASFLESPSGDGGPPASGGAGKLLHADSIWEYGVKRAPIPRGSGEQPAGTPASVFYKRLSAEHRGYGLVAEELLSGDACFRQQIAFKDPEASLGPAACAMSRLDSAGLQRLTTQLDAENEGPAQAGAARGQP